MRTLSRRPVLASLFSTLTFAALFASAALLSLRVALAQSCDDALVPTIQRSSSVGIDTLAGDSILALVTTTTGTLRPLAGSIPVNVVPLSMHQRLLEANPTRDPMDTPWDLLSPSEQREVITYSARQRIHLYGASPTIPGLTYRPTMTLNLEKPLRTNGKVYGPGVVTIPTAEIFGDSAIEYMGPKNMNGDLGFSLRVAGGRSATENYSIARAVESALLKDQSNLRENISGPYPSSTALNRFRMLYFSQLVRMSSDFTMIAARRALPAADGLLVAKTLVPTDQSEVLKLWRDQSTTDFAPLNSLTGTVAVRSHHFAGGQGEWTIVLRYLPRDLGVRVAHGLIGVAQRHMQNGTLALSERDAQSIGRRLLYMKNGGRHRPSYTIGGLDFPGQTIADLSVADINAALFLPKMPAPSISGRLSLTASARLMALLEANDHIRYLFPDWSRTAYGITWSKAENTAVRNAQIEALNQLFALAESSPEQAKEQTPAILAHFIKRSGLNELIRKSLNK